VHVAIRHAEFHDAGDFLAKANTAGAMNTPAHLLHGDQRPDTLVENDVLLFRVATLHRTVADSHVLQLALAPLIANRAIERMIDQQELHHALLCLDRQLGVCEHLHAIRHRRRTSRQWLGGLLHLHETHTAVGGDRKFLVVAEMRDIHANLLRGIHHRAAVGHLRLFAVDFDF